jgi:tetratricopeptide (TPR) repeat protein
VDLARKYGNPDSQAYALSAKGMALARLGHFSEAQAMAQAAIDIIPLTGSPVTESDVELFTAWACLDMGDAPASLAHGQRSVAVSLATDNFDCICGGLACLGFGHMQSGQLTKAAAAFEQAIEHTKISGAARLEVLARGGLALARLASGQPEALAELEHEVARAHELQDSFAEAFFLHALAEARLGQGDLTGARASLAQALPYFQRNDLGPYLARALATQAALDERQALP